MKALKKTVLGAAMALALAGGAQASIINVGGVEWDPDSVIDFFGKTSFYQWFQSGSTGLDADGAVSMANSTSPVGNYLTGAGKFTDFNDANNIPGDPNPETNPALFCSGCELTYTFGGLKITSFTGSAYLVDWSSAYINVYVDSNRDFNSSLGTNYTSSDVAKAGNGTLFLGGFFDSFIINSAGLLGTTLYGDVISTISVDDGLALGNFDTNTIPNPLLQAFILSDLTYSGSAQFRVNTPIGAQHSSGTGEVQGQTIPEPGTLALAGLALVGLGFAKRRKIQK